MKTIRMWIARRIIALSALLSDQMATNPIQVGGSDDHTATNPIVIESDDSETGMYNECMLLHDHLSTCTDVEKFILLHIRTQESHNTPSPSCNAEETLANPEGTAQHACTYTLVHLNMHTYL